MRSLRGLAIGLSVLALCYGSAEQALASAPPPGVDLVVASANINPQTCYLQVELSNIGTAAAPPSQSVSVTGQGLQTGVANRWNSTTLAPQSSVMVNFGVVVSWGLTLTLTADALGLQPELVETNNDRVINVPKGCRYRAVPGATCGDLFVLEATHPNAGVKRLHEIDRITHSIVSTVNVPWITSDIAFRNGELWGAGVAYWKLNPTTGAVLQTLTNPGAGSNALGFSTTGPTSGKLLAENQGNVVTFDPTTGTQTVVATATPPYFTGDVTQHLQSFYAVRENFGFGDGLAKVDIGSGTVTTVGQVPVPSRGLASVRTGAQTVELWSGDYTGGLWSLNPANGSGTLVANIGMEIDGMATVDCPGV